VGLRDTFLAACAGNQEAGGQLYVALGAMVPAQLKRMPSLHQADGDDAQSTVLMRIWKSKQKFLDELVESAAAPSLHAIRKASRRGATPASIAHAIGRPLSPAELGACDPLLDDTATRKYLVSALRNALTDRLRKLNREAAPPADVATPPEPTRFDAEVPTLLVSILQGFVTWANGRSEDSGNRYRSSLDQLRAAPKGGARAVVLAEDPTLSGDALRRAAGTRRRHWSRARKAFDDYVQNHRRFKRHERELLPDVLRFFDSEYRIRKPPRKKPSAGSGGVRKSTAVRPAAPHGGSP